MTVYDLASEIVNEFKLPDAKAVEMKLGYSKSGLLYKLKKILNFDAKEMANGSKEEQFRMYKLLKVLYIFEKIGKPKKVRAYDTESKIKIKIIDILAKPRYKQDLLHLVISSPVICCIIHFLFCGAFLTSVQRTHLRQQAAMRKQLLLLCRGNYCLSEGDRPRSCLS